MLFFVGYVNRYYIEIWKQVQSDMKNFNTRYAKSKKARFRFGKLTQLTMILLRFCFKTNMVKGCRECCVTIMNSLGLVITEDQFKEFIENITRNKRVVDILVLAKNSNVDLQKPMNFKFDCHTCPPGIMRLIAIFAEYEVKVIGNEINSISSGHQSTITPAVLLFGDQTFPIRTYDEFNSYKHIGLLIRIIAPIYYLTRTKCPRIQVKSQFPPVIIRRVDKRTRHKYRTWYYKNKILVIWKITRNQLLSCIKCQITMLVS